MSNLNAIGLIAATFFGAAAVNVWFGRWAHDLSDAVFTGIIRGSQVSTKYRWLLLFNSWMPVVFVLILVNFVFALVFIGIAQNVGNGFVNSLAYICAVGNGFGCAVWLLLGISWFLLFVSVLRQADAD